MKFPLNQTWNLDNFFAGGSDSSEYASFLTETEDMVRELSQELEQIQPPQTAAESGSLIRPIELVQQLLLRLREASAFQECLQAANTADKRAVQLGGHVRTIYAAFQSALTRFDQLLRSIPDAAWNTIVEQEAFVPVAFSLSERRTQALEKLPPEQEALIGDLAVDGYHGWDSLYSTIVGHFSVEHEENGEKVQLSAGRGHNKLHTGDRAVRAALWEKWEQAWADRADYCADALNHLAGFRLQVYKHRGWKSVLKEPLAINRMSEETLQTMWRVIEKNKPMLVKYLNRKAKLLGLEKLSWHDVEAPIGSAAKHVSYDEAAQIIVDQFRGFSPKMADFSAMAFDNRWIEAEDRSGKRPGGFCTSFPIKEETRIFMTYGGTASNVSTLAHELGHAYHQHVVNDLPAMSQEYAMNVAETASTLAEAVVGDALVKLAADPQEKLALLEDKIQRAVAFFMNIHARFLFETRFYEERRSGLVSVERLNELMVEAQREAFCGALADYHPHFWAMKLHFYSTEVPFYNFPYTFGFLFSAGIYAAATKEGPAFEDKYVELLRDTGRMQVEDLAAKHLGIDLRQPDFWQQAVDLTMKDVEEFLALTE